MTLRIPASRNSSRRWTMTGMRPSGNNSLGTALLAGHILVACPAAAITAVLTFGGASIRFDSLRPSRLTQLTAGPLGDPACALIVRESIWQDIKGTANRANLSARGYGSQSSRLVLTL